jgi:hypothetical protein
LRRRRRRIGIGFDAGDILATFRVPCAAYWVLREISWVAAPCSSTAAAIAVATS